MAGQRDERVVVLAQGRDGPLTAAVLGEAGFDCSVCAGPDELCSEAADQPGALILAEEVLTEGTVRRLVEALERQPPWSDLPVLVIASERQGAARLLQTFDVLGNVSVLQRPLPLDTLATAVRAALRARRRQLQVRDLLRERAEADRRKDEFLAMLAHELRNPLAPVRTASHVLRLQAGAEPVFAPALDVIDRQVKHLARLVDDLLDVSRITRGKVELRKQRVRLAEVVDQAGESVRPLVEQKGHSLSVSLPPEPVELEADPTRLAQVLANLLNNSAKYTDPGGQINLSAGREGPAVVVRVRDNGVGIEPDVLPRVFELFAQANRPLDRSQGGLGIGLTIVKSLVELHGGFVEAHSEGPGRGTEVVVRLPALPPGVPPAPGVRPAGECADGKRLRVLVVEDHLDGARTLRILLGMWGHEVRVAHTGPEGLAAARAEPPDVAILDIGLPGMSGYELARALRQTPGLAGVALVAATGYGREADKARAREAGFDLHLTKPVDVEELRAFLARVGSGSAQARR